MAKRWIIFLAALYTTVAALPQTAFSHDSQQGVLRRFNVSDSERGTILAAAQHHDLDVWNAGKSHIDIYTPPEGGFPTDLQNLPHTTSFVPLYQTRDQHLSLRPWRLGTLQNSTFHEVYHPLPEIRKFLRKLEELHPNVTQLSKIGLSAEGRPIHAVTLSKTSSLVEAEGAKKKKKKKKKRPTEKLDFVIVGAQHAREWIATATSLYIAHGLTVNSSTAEPHGLSSLLEVFNIHLIPVPNPDGYSYTWDSDRYWYKNRQIIAPHSKCVGVDMNRNWGYKWDGAEVEMEHPPSEMADPCSHWYPGTRAFESPEVNSIANFVSTLRNPVALVNLRSYGQMISSPYSYSCARRPKDAEDQAEAAFGAAHAIKNVHDAHFEVGRLCENLYEAPGNIIDWMYQRAGIKYTYVAHLRDTGTWGFSLPDKWIRPVGEETASMIHYLAKFIAAKHGRKL